MLSIAYTSINKESLVDGRYSPMIAPYSMNIKVSSSAIYGLSGTS